MVIFAFNSILKKMAINYTIEADDGLLRVVAAGKDDNLRQVKDYGFAVLSAALSSRCTKVLCDERELIYSLGTFDSFESAKYISELAPDIAKVAIVCRPENIEDADFWETVAVNRGLHVRVFKTLAEAESWLKKAECP